MEENNRNIEEEDKWSQLPTLLLWMVIDRVNFGDKVRLASVCKKWQLDSSNYPPKPRQKNCVNPWVMFQNFLHTVPLVFTNPQTMEKLILDHPDFNYYTRYLFSRRGWLLLRQLHRQGNYIILLNLHTNAKFIMPDPGPHVHGLMATFSFSSSSSSSSSSIHDDDDDDDTPRCLVYATSASFYITHIGDKTWTQHSYENQTRMKTLASLVLCENKVYFMDKIGKLFIYDMANLSWKTVATDNMKPNRKIYTFEIRCFIMESQEREILKIDEDKDGKTFSFFKLNESETSWEELNHLEGRRWFLCGRNNHFTVKNTQGLNKVHKLATYSEGYRKFYQKYPMIEPENHRGKWVDLGWMDKVPPYCTFAPTIFLTNY